MNKGDLDSTDGRQLPSSSASTSTSSIPTFPGSSTAFSSEPNYEARTLERKVVLLRLYTIYKEAKFVSPAANESVWNEIAEHLTRLCQLKTDGQECYKMISDMIKEYDKKIHKPPSLSNWSLPIFLDEAENAFGHPENPVIFTLESDLKNFHMVQEDKVKLLEVYAKYKADLPNPRNFDKKKQVIWEKIAKEISEICSCFYGKRRCCREVNHHIEKKNTNIRRKNKRKRIKEKKKNKEMKKNFFRSKYQE